MARWPQIRYIGLAIFFALSGAALAQSQADIVTQPTALGEKQ